MILSKVHFIQAAPRQYRDKMESIDLDYEEDQTYADVDDDLPSRFNPATSLADASHVLPEDFGIEPTKQIEQASEECIDELYRDLEITRQHSHHCILVHGGKGMNKYELEKVFAAYSPCRVEKETIQSEFGMVHFQDREETAAMMIAMSKPVRRVRERQAPEDGEVESDNEDGQLKEEAGDQVAIVNSASQARKENEDVVELNMDSVHMPDGVWRIVTKHVPPKRILLVRYATKQEIVDYRRSRVEDDRDEESKLHERKMKPGLNVFNTEGKELSWNYEHDTRFYDEEEGTETKADAEETTEKVEVDNTKGAPQAVKVRGRGAKKGRMLYSTEDGGSTLASDDLPTMQKRARKEPEDREEEDWKSQPIDDSEKPKRVSNVFSRLTKK